MKIKDLVLGATYWARYIAPMEIDSKASVIVHDASTLAPLLGRVPRTKKTAVLQPYVYMDREIVPRRRGRVQTTLYKFLSKGKLVYAPGSLIAGFHDISPEHVIARLAAVIPALDDREKTIILHMVNPHEAAHELLVIHRRDYGREFKLVRRSSHGRRDAINHILQNITNIEKYEFFSQEGEPLRLMVKSTCVAKTQGQPDNG